jgi:hypothetical protein
MHLPVLTPIPTSACESVPASVPNAFKSAVTGLLAWTLCTLCTLSHTPAAHAQLAKRDLTLEIRQIEMGQDDGPRYGAGPSERSPTWDAQSIQVRSGAKASVQMQESIPMQWLHSASGPNPAGAAALPPQQNASPQSPSAPNTGRQSIDKATNAGHKNASITHELVWFDTGQQLSVLPRWNGGNSPVLLELELQRASVGERVSGDLPTQSRKSVTTSLTIPLGQWITVAASGKLGSVGNYSSEAGQMLRRVLQVRVTAPY